MSSLLTHQTHHTYFMKLLKNPTYYLFFLLIGLLLFSCKKDKSQELLHRAQYNLAINKAGTVISLLDSIPRPENMDIDSYMRYIITYTGAKYEVGKDITGDTIILRAQRYFTDKGNIQDRVLANFYAAQLYNIYKLYPQALESFMYAIYESKESGNELFVGRSYNNIGYIYFKQQLYDSAVVNYQKALHYYEKVGNVDLKKLRTLTYIGSSYEALNQLDSAYLSFDKCLSLAKKINNETYQFYSLKNLGVVCYGKQDYEKAILYFQSALAINISDEVDQLETQKSHLYLLNIYNKKKDLETAKQYADLVIASLPKVTYKHTIKEMYAALADYYQQLGNYKQALEYRDLEKATKEQIEEEGIPEALFEADKNVYLVQKDREILELRSDVVFFLIIGVVVFGIILAFVLFLWKDHKKNQAEIRACADKYEMLEGMLHSMSDHYPRVEAEIKSMMDDIDDKKGDV